MLPNQTSVDSFTKFTRDAEPGLRRALTAGFGSEVGREAAAEALAYGWQHWERVEGLANPAGYLFRVGQNKARRLIAGRARRRMGRSPWSGHDEIVFAEPWVEPSFGPAWGRLSDRQRIVVGLIHAFDWSYGEVAELLGISRSSVQSYEKRAMQKLRRDLGVGG